MRRTIAVAAAAAGLVVAAAGCGSSSGGAYTPPTGPAVKTIPVQASSFKFAPNKISAPAGILEFKLTSEDIQHSFRIKDVNGFQLEAGGGKTATGKVKLAPGTYTFYCDIPGHESSGMKGTLTVT